MQCNICGSKDFKNMSTRSKVRCAQCNSLERTRLMWLFLKTLKIGKKSKILHIAPEQGIYRALRSIVDEKNYIAADLFPELFPFVNSCQKIDLCHLDEQPSCHYDIILHSHVMEHVPCNIAYPLYHLHRMLKKDGKHVCIIPFMDGCYDECFQDIGPQERLRRFGQEDHVRRFGNQDIASHLGAVLNIPERFDATQTFSKETLIAANIPKSHWRGFHIGTVLMLNRNDMKFIGK